MDLTVPSAMSIMNELYVETYGTMSRKENVALNDLLDTPCFEWLDANEEKSTTFLMSIQETEADMDAAPSLDFYGFEM